MSDKKGYVNGVRVYAVEDCETVVMDFARPNEICPRIINITEVEARNLQMALGLFFHNKDKNHG